MESESKQEHPSVSGIDEKLLSLLVCPACHEPVQQRGELLVCRGCGLGYPVKDGIPMMLLSEAIRPQRGQTGLGERNNGL